MWTTAHSQILILDNLMLRGRPLENWCCMFCYNEESVGDLIFCPLSHSFVGAFASVVWDSLDHARFCC